MEDAYYRGHTTESVNIRSGASATSFGAASNQSARYF